MSDASPGVTLDELLGPEDGPYTEEADTFVGTAHLPQVRPRGATNLGEHWLRYRPAPRTPTLVESLRAFMGLKPR